MLEKVISGGQTGVDQAALFAAKDFGLKTGGTMPASFKTLSGTRPEFERMFGVVADKSYEYSPRTAKNVANSDGTIRIAEYFSSAGERCTKRYINQYNKPSLDIQVMQNKLLWTPYIDDRHIYRLVEFINENNIAVLNVAGNSESTSPGIYDTTYLFLLKVFKELMNGK